ncbi:MAG: VWA domain-containing protein [Chitinophagaceae bacterium]
MFEIIDYSAFYWLLLPLLLYGTWLFVAKKMAVQYRLLQPLLQHNAAVYQFAIKRRRFLYYCLALSVLLLALANVPVRKPQGKTITLTQGADIAFALDVSKSMLSQDEKPNRLGKAKMLIKNVQQQMPGNRFSLVLFAGDAFLQSPLTADITAANLLVDNAHVDAVPLQGTNLAKAIQVADASLNVKDATTKTIVLITDGEDQEPDAIETLLPKLKEKGIVVHTIGLGNTDGVPFSEPGTNDYKKDINGATIFSKRNDELLQKIAANSGGQYFSSTSLPLLIQKTVNILQDSSIRKTKASSGTQNYFFMNTVLVAIGLMILLIEFFTKSYIKKSVPKKHLAFWGFFLLQFSLVNQLVAQVKDNDIYKGNKAFEQKNYQQAITHYQQAQTNNEVKAIALYNWATALYKMNKIPLAAVKYDEAITIASKQKSKELLSKIQFNRAMMAVAMKEWNTAIHHFKQSLKADTHNSDARENLQKLLNTLQPPNKEQSNKQQPNKDENNALSKKELTKEMERLNEMEKQLQKAILQRKQKPLNPEKDW